MSISLYAVSTENIMWRFQRNSFEINVQFCSLSSYKLKISTLTNGKTLQAESSF